MYLDLLRLFPSPSDTRTVPPEDLTASGPSSSLAFLGETPAHTVTETTSGDNFHRCAIRVIRTLEGLPIYYEAVEVNVKRKNTDKKKPREPGIKVLTGREQEVFEWTLRGLSNEEVGKRLDPPLTVKGVKYHLTNVFKKKGVHSRVQLIVKYMPRELDVPTAS